MGSFKNDVQQYEKYMKRVSLTGCKDVYSVDDLLQCIILEKAYPDANGVFVIQPFVSMVRSVYQDSVFPSSVKRLKVINRNNRLKAVDGLFRGCRYLEYLDLSEFDTNGVLHMSSMFKGCESLKQLDLSNFNTSTVLDMSNMFYNCKSLKTLDLSNFDTSKVRVMDCMFSQCVQLTSLNLSSFNTERVSDFSFMFYGCCDVEQLNVKNFVTSSARNMRGMFMSCFALSSLNLSSFITDNVGDFTGMFHKCNRLRTLDLRSFIVKDTAYVATMFLTPSLRNIIVNKQALPFLSASTSGVVNSAKFTTVLADKTYVSLMKQYNISANALAKLLQLPFEMYKQLKEGVFLTPQHKKQLETLRNPSRFKELLLKNGNCITERQYNLCLKAVNKQVGERNDTI